MTPPTLAHIAKAVRRGVHGRDRPRGGCGHGPKLRGLSRVSARADVRVIKTRPPYGARRGPDLGGEQPRAIISVVQLPDGPRRRDASAGGGLSGRRGECQEWGRYGDGVTSAERIARLEQVRLTNLDEPLFDDAEATKRDLVDYLEAIGEQLLGELRDRPLSVIRALRGQKPFMQKNVPKYAPPWVRTVKIWAERSKREVAYALCNDRPTLLWFANQRAVEYHPTLVRLGPPDPPQTHLVLDIDPPAGAPFDAVVDTAELVR